MKAVVTLIAVGTVLVCASAEEASAAEPTDYRRFDAILFLVERDVKAVRDVDHRVGNRAALEGLAKTYRSKYRATTEKPSSSLARCIWRAWVFAQTTARPPSGSPRRVGKTILLCTWPKGDST